MTIVKRKENEKLFPLSLSLQFNCIDGKTNIKIKCKKKKFKHAPTTITHIQRNMVLNMTFYLRKSKKKIHHCHHHHQAILSFFYRFFSFFFGQRKNIDTKMNIFILFHFIFYLRCVSKIKKKKKERNIEK